jgi:hypothetical protein
MFSSLIFLLVVNSYSLTHKLLAPMLGPILVKGVPTAIGLALHTLIYVLIVRYSMDLDLFDPK